MDLYTLLGRVTTMTDDRKRELSAKYGANTLTQAEKDELTEHITRAMAEVEIDIEAAKSFLRS